MSKSHANRLIQHHAVVEILTPMGVIMPTSERQTRPLASLEPEQQREVWKEVIEMAPDGKVTTRQIRRAANLRKPKSEPTEAMRIATFIICHLEWINDPNNGL